MTRDEMIQTIMATCSVYPKSFWRKFSDVELDKFVNDIAEEAVDYDELNFREALKV